MSDEDTPAGLRASDDDREQLADELRDHAVAGRLDTDELEQRLDRLYAARTQDELSALRADLPPTPRSLALSHAQRRAQLSRRMLQEAGASLGLFIVCAIIWAASGFHGQFWPAWILIVVVLTLARNGWALFGPAPDLDAVEQQLDARGRTRAAHRERALQQRERAVQRRERRRPR